MKLGDVIREYRIKNRMSMGDFAKKSGISKPYVSMLESNKNSRDGKSIVPSITTLQKISRAINISLNDLLHMLDGNQSIDLKPDTLNDEQIELIKGYDSLDAGGRKVIMDMIGQLNFGNRAVRKVARSSTVTLSAEVERPAAVARPLRLSRSSPRIHFNNVRPEGNVPSAVVKAIGGLDSVKKITGVEVEAVGVLAKTVGVGKRMTVDKPVISARSFKDD